MKPLDPTPYDETRRHKCPKSGILMTDDEKCHWPEGLPSWRSMAMIAAAKQKDTMREARGNTELYHVFRDIEALVNKRRDL